MNDLDSFLLETFSSRDVILREDDILVKLDDEDIVLSYQEINQIDEIPQLPKRYCTKIKKQLKLYRNAKKIFYEDSII